MKEILITVVFLYVLTNLAIMFGGISHANLELFGYCHKPKTRIGLVFPGYDIGCWLGKPVGSK